MKVFVENDYDAMSERAFSFFLKFLPDTRVLGLATGSSPIGLYNRICEAYKEGKISLKSVHTFNLDEYYGLENAHPESYRTFMDTNLFGKVDIMPQNIHFPDSKGEPSAIADRYNSQLDKIGHPDLQILGIGQNGHIAFNEPGSPRHARTRVVRLTQNTIDVNVPPSKYAVTMGLEDILSSRRIILLASGKSKANAVSRMIQGPLGYSVPASYLQEHPETYVILDTGAASLLDTDAVEKRIRESMELGSDSYYLDL